MQEFLEIAIVGGGLSAFVQYFKDYIQSKTGISPFVFIICLALVVSALYHSLVGTDAWQVILNVLGSATIVYRFLLKDSGFPKMK